MTTFRNNKVEIYLHYVWTTHSRHPMIRPEIERELYRCIEAACRKEKCDVLAVGGTEDHVHLAIKLPTTTPPYKVMQTVKGTSSAFARDHLVKPGDSFCWQDGYGVFSFSRSHKTLVINYISKQKEHHQTGELWPDVEDPTTFVESDSP